MNNITVDGGPSDVTVNPTSGRVYAADSNDDTLGFIDPCPTPSCLSITSFQAAPASFLVRGGTNLTTELDYAVGKPTYAYTGLPPGCASANRSVLFCRPTTSGNFTVEVNVSDQTGKTVHANLTLSVERVYYAATFSETGLPAGTNWSVDLNGTVESSLTSSLGFREPAGAYPYSVGAPGGYAATPQSGNLTVNSSSTTVVIAFAPATFVVLFEEDGLPGGTEWWLDITGGTRASSDTSTLSFEEVNGTYHYSVAAANRTFSAAGGSFRINGTGYSQTVQFTRVDYTLSFVESGLPPGTAWSVALSESSAPSLSTTNTVAFRVPNGTYTYEIAGVQGWSTPQYTGRVQVLGQGTPTIIPFSQVTYRVTLTEVGLPAGTEWWANVSGGGPSVSSATPQLSFAEPNGTFRYILSTTDKRESAPPGSVTVQGGSNSTTLQFSDVSFSVSFNETGLPNGTSWSVVLNGSTITGVGVLDVGGLVNGTYEFSVLPIVNYNATPANGPSSSSVPQLTGRSSFRHTRFAARPPPTPPRPASWACPPLKGMRSWAA